MSHQDLQSGAVAAAINGVGPLARRLNQIHARLWHEQVDADLTGPQFTVLSLLHTQGEMDQGTLCALAYLDKSTAAPLLDRLHRRELVEITRDSADRRRKVVHITDTGSTLAVRLAPAVVAVSEQILTQFSPEERDQLLRLLHRATEGQQQTVPEDRVASVSTASD